MSIDYTMRERTNSMTGCDWSAIRERGLGKAVNRKSQIVNVESSSPSLPRRAGIERSSSGFTLIELIVVIIALAILAGTAVVSFRVTDQDKSTIAADQLIADIQYVQMRAMGIGNSQSIEFRYDASNFSAYRILDNIGNPIEDKTLAR